jgi:ABC-type antimicrobial peptide transport system permease subunit
VYSPITIPAADRPDSAVVVPRIMSVVVRTAGDPATLASAGRRVVTDLRAGIPIYDVQPMTDVLERWMAQTTFVLGALSAAAAITLVLGGVGLYGVIAYSVSMRTRELGVRLALGAAPHTIRGMILREGMVLAGIGVVIGVAAFLGVGRALRRLLFEVGIFDPLTLAATVLVLIAISSLASWLPARRAARADPLEALRAE